MKSDLLLGKLYTELASTKDSMRNLVTFPKIASLISRDEKARNSRRKWRDAPPELLQPEASQDAAPLELEHDKNEQVIEIITKNIEWSAGLISKRNLKRVLL